MGFIEVTCKKNPAKKYLVNIIAIQLVEDRQFGSLITLNDQMETTVEVAEHSNEIKRKIEEAR